jgi:hypothetical protein
MMVCIAHGTMHVFLLAALQVYDTEGRFVPQKFEEVRPSAAWLACDR